MTLAVDVPVVDGIPFARAGRDDLRADAVAPESQAFHTADVLDRVLQVHHHARAAAFTASQALDDLELVHAGPVQTFHHRVLAAAGLGA